MPIKPKSENLKQADYLKVLEDLYATIPYGNSVIYDRFMRAMGQFIHKHELPVVEAANNAASKGG